MVIFFSILDTISTFYKNTFKKLWKDKVNVIAALVVENEMDVKSRFETVVFAAGTKYKTDVHCSYVKNQTEKSWQTWDFCDGHAEALCYKLSCIYMLTEIYKVTNTSEYSIFQVNSDQGYELKEGIKFHLLISYHPCGFMQKMINGSLSWKCFSGLPHIFECSSIILIGAYLGIQGPLSCILTKPVYISSLVILRETRKNDTTKDKSKIFLDSSTIENNFKSFYKALNIMSTIQNNYEAFKSLMQDDYTMNKKLQTSSSHCKFEKHAMALKMFCTKVHHFDKTISAVYQQLLDFKSYLKYKVKIPKICVTDLEDITKVFPGISSTDNTSQAKVGFLLPNVLAVDSENKILMKKFSFNAHNKHVENIAITIENYVSKLKININSVRIQTELKQVRFDLLKIAIGRFTKVLIEAKNAQMAHNKNYLVNKIKNHKKHLEAWHNISAKLERKEIVPKEEVNSTLNTLNNDSKAIKQCESMQKGFRSMNMITIKDANCDWARYLDELYTYL